MSVWTMWMRRQNRKEKEKKNGKNTESYSALVNGERCEGGGWWTEGANAVTLSKYETIFRIRSSHYGLRRDDAIFAVRMCEG